MIEPCTTIEQPGWLRLREALWPHCAEADHRAEMRSLLAQPERFAQYVFYSEPNVAVGFVEASLRNDYVPGTNSSPVAFLEGIYVAPDARHHGVAARLVSEIERWARARGCTELASDTQLENGASQRVHEALGFRQTERIVCFAKHLR